MKRILFLLLSISFIQFFTNDVFAGNTVTYPTGISASVSGGAVCLGQARTLTASLTTTTCGSGGSTATTNTVTWFYNGTTNSNTGGSTVATGNSIAVTSPADCGVTHYYYAVVSWSTVGCATAGSVTSAAIAVAPNNCDCIAPGRNTSYTGCGTTFYDTGGASGNYFNNQDYTVTFCPSGADNAISIDFSAFNTEGTATGCTDCMYIWQGNSATGDPDDMLGGSTVPPTVVSSSPDGCITLRFQSNGSTTASGWAAAVTCVARCQTPTAVIGSPDVLNICPSDADNPGNMPVNFSAAGSSVGPYGSGGFSLSQYIWDFGDNTSTTTTTETTSHTFSDYGSFSVRLVVRDDNTGNNPNGCPSTNSANLLVNILRAPLITANNAFAECNTCADLQVVATPQTATTPINSSSGVAFPLPDGSGNSHFGTINMDGAFPSGATVTADCFPTVCFDIDHSYSGDLSFRLIAPDGTEVLLRDRMGGSNMFGDCTKQEDDGAPGCPRTYCVVSSGAANSITAMPTSTAGGNCPPTFDGTCERATSSVYYVAGTYNSQNNFNPFIGSPLNGTWTLRITDHLTYDDGWIHDWSISFPDACYGDVGSITPDVTSVTWGSGVTSTGSSTVTVSEPGPDFCPGTAICEGDQITANGEVCYAVDDIGTFSYDYAVTDEYGCIYSGSVNVDVSCNCLAIATLALTGDASICPSSCSQISITVGDGTGPYNVVYSNGTSNFTLSSIAEGTHLVDVCPTANATYTLVSIEDIGAACYGNISGSASITILPTIQGLSCPGTITSGCVIEDVPAYATWAEFIAAGGSANLPVGATIDESSFTLLSEDSNDSSCPITYVRTYRVADNCGATVSCSQNVVVGSITTITMPDPGASTVACATNATAPTPPTVQDNCGRDLTISAPVVSADPACAGDKTYTYTYTDCSGATYPWVYTYTISAPVVTMPDPGASTVACATNATAPTPPTVQDNCGRDLTISAPVVSADPACAGDKTYTYTYTDCSGATYPWVYTYTISAPVVTMPDPGASTVACATNATAPTPPTVQDNCGRDLTISAPVVSADPACAGDKTYTYTYTDCSNATYTWVYTYTISAPVVTMPDNEGSTVACATNATAPTPPAVQDNCGRDLTISAPVVSADPACAGDKTYTYTYTDCSNATYTWVYTYTISAPVVTMPDNEGSTVACATNATAPTPPAVQDNCGRDLTISAPVVSADPACAGDKTYTYTYTDCSNATYTWVYTYTISAPVVTMPDPGASTVACATNATAPTPPTVQDNCGRDLTISAPVVSADPACAGDKTYTYTYTDCSNATYTWVYTYTISAPVVTMPDPGASTVACATNATAPTPPTVQDNCGRDLTISAPVVSADPACAGDKTYTYTYTDCSNATYPWVYTYTISAPVVTMPDPGASTVACATNATAPTPPTVQDNCGRDLTISAPVVSADPACAGDKTYTYTYTDCSNSTYTWVYTYTISAPVVTMPDNEGSTVACATNATAPTPPAVQDNCGRDLTISAPVVSADPACAGDKTYTYTYTDCSNSTYTWVYTYTISAPVVTMPDNEGSTVACATNATAPTPPAVQDNCGRDLTISAPVVSADPACAGDKTYTYTYTDCSNATYTWVYTYTISAPVVTMPDPGASTVACASNATAPTPPAVQDNCGRDLTISVPVVSADPACAGDKTYTYTYTDCSNATYTWVYTYTISAPVVTMPDPGASTVACATNATAPTPPTVQDNCGRDLTISAPVVSADPACAGDKTYTYTYTDCSNATYEWVYTYTIDIPAFTIPYADAGSTVNCVVDATDPGAPGDVFDACNNLLTPVITAPNASGCSGLGAQWIYTYTDCAGNSAAWTYTYTIDLLPFTLPFTDDVSTVNCLVDAQVEPTPPGIVEDLCGNALTPVVTTPADITCEGDMAWVFTYTDCAGNTLDWTYTYTIDLPAFTLPFADDVSTVNCLVDAQVEPTPPGVVEDMCGNVLTPVVTTPADITCEGDMAWIFTYTDCAGNTLDWTYTYTIDLPAFTLPFSDDASTVNCLVDAQVEPTPPGVVEDMCGNALTPVVTTPADITCEGDMAWVFTYTDCAGNTLDWTYTYTIDLPAFTLPFADDVSTVNCLVDAQVEPTPPGVVEDMCGNVLTPVVTTPADITCEGDMAWVFTYTDCAGNTLDWTYTYTIDLPAFTLPFTDDALTVNCLVDAQVEPTPPGVVEDLCGNALTPVVTTPADIACEGDMAWVFTYTDCAGNTAAWTYTYTIDIPAFTIPYADAGSTVNCVVDATDPGAPGDVFDACNNLLTPVITAPNASGCSGLGAQWIYTYTDCAGNTAAWTYTYTIDLLPFTLPFADDVSTVNCLVDAQVEPTPPGVVEDLCGNALTPVVTTPADITCEGDMAWVFTYTDCAGNTLDWTYTYTIDLPAFALPFTDDTETVNCLVDAQVEPTPPGVVEDLCGNALTPVVTTPADITCEGDMAWVFTYTDCAGNTLDWMYTYTIDLPAFAIAFPDGSSTVNCLVDAQVEPTPPGVVEDMCGNALTPVVTTPADITCEGDMAWIFTYTDCAGNTLDWTYTYTIDLPAFTLPFADDVSTVNCLVDAQVEPTPPGIVEDLCGNALTPVVTTPADITCEGDMAWVFTYTDCAGNTLDWTYTYTIDLPAFTLPFTDDALTVNCLVDAQVEPTPPGVVEDLCGNALTPVVTTPADIACEGDMAWVFTYTDCAGNTAAWTYTYTIDIPAFTIPYADAGSTVNCVVDATDPGAPGDVFDACNNLLTPVITAPNASGCSGLGAQWIYTYTDCAGNTAAWTYTYTIDLLPFTLPFADDVSTVNCLVDAQVEPTPPGVVEDLCGNALTPVVTTPADITCEGDMAWVFTYTDCAGNTLDWTYTYTIDLPAFALPFTDDTETVNCLVDAQVEPTPPGVVEDLCGNALTPVVTTPADITCEGDMAWVFTYTDCAGNTLDWMYTYTIDLPAFAIAFPDGSSTVNCLVDAQVEPTPPGVVEDMCGNALTPVVTTPADITCEGDMAWVFTYTDCAGNTLDWTYTYTIDLPAFTLPFADDVSTVNCLVDAQVEPTPPGIVEDLCGNALTPVVTTPADITCEGDMAWVFTYTDCAGNTLDWTYTYTIDLPAFTLPFTDDALTVNCLVDAQVEPTPPGVVEDLCGNVLTPVVTTPADIACEGDMAWVFTYTDCAGNTLAWTYTYTIDFPAFTIPYADAGSTVNCVVDATDPGAPGDVFDACGNLLTPVITAPNASGCTGLGAQWIYTYTDCAGNTAAWTYTYTIDLPPFTIPFVDDASTVNCLVDAQVEPTPPSIVEDLCGNEIVPVVTIPADVTCEGDMAWVFTYTDCAGNTTDWTYTYTIDLPAFTLPFADDASTVNCLVDAQVEPTPPSAVVDLCGNVLTPVVTTPADVTCEGDMAWVFTYTDCAGNTLDWTYTYTIDLPAFTVPFADDASTVSCLVDAQVQPTPPGTVIDMCGNTLTPVVTIPTDVACQGDMAWIFTYTDCAGNAAAWTYTFTINDDVAPVGTVPADVFVQCIDDVPAVNIASVTGVSDNCTAVPTVIHVSDVSSGTTCPEVITRTYRISDDCNNYTDVVQTITINDDIAPVGTAPADVFVQCIGDVPVVNTASLTGISDNCTAVPTVIHVSDISSGTTCPEVITRTYRISDDCNNFIDVVQTITINDDVAPVGIAPANVTVQCIGEVPVVNTASVTGVSDNCTAVPTVVHVSDVSNGGLCPEVITRTYRISDDCNNFIEVVQTITINDDVAPIASNPATINVACASDVPAPNPSVVTDATDNCGVASIVFVNDVSDMNVCNNETIIRTYRITDYCGNSTTVSQTIVINSVTPTFTLTSTNPTTCEGNQGTITMVGLLPSTGYNVSYNNGTESTIYTTMNGEYTFTGLTAGTYSNFIVNLANCPMCSAYSNQAVTLTDPAPPIVDAGNDRVLCDGESVVLTAYATPQESLLTWEPAIQNGIAFTPAVGTQVYTVTAENLNCFTQDQVTVTVNPIPFVNAGPDQTVCKNAEIILRVVDMTVGADLSWSDGVVNGEPFTQPVGTRSYTATVTHQGCSASDNTSVEVLDDPEVLFTADAVAACVPSTITFTSNSDPASVNCQWTIGNNTTVYGCETVSHTFNTPGCYDVTLSITTDLGCQNTETYTNYVCIDVPPIASFTASSYELTLMNTNVDFTNTSRYANTYEWNFGDGSEFNTEIHPSYEFPNGELDGDVTYPIQLVAFSPNGVCTDTATVSILVKEDLIYWVPNTFTPDGDEYNPVFLPVFTSGFDPYNYTLLIFNRWGEIIFESHNAKVGWDGTYGGKIVQDGTYIWKISFKDKYTDEKIQKIGHVNILR
jgi:gliding motility-associated-like protein